jgi:hypothetical protein
LAPRAGGEADKIGNRYEAAWAIWHALRCLRESRTALTVEEFDPDLGKGSEFTFVSEAGTEVHQVKRQIGSANEWTIKALHAKGIWAAAKDHVAAGRIYYFISLIACGVLKDLADRGRRAPDLASFTQHGLSNRDLIAAFTELSAPEILGSPDVAWKTLAGMRFEVVDEHHLVETNALIASLCLEGADGHLAALALGDLIVTQLGVKLTKDNLLSLLHAKGIKQIAPQASSDSRERVRAVTDSWRESVSRELLDPPLPRAEAAEVVESLRSKDVTMVVGAAGGGKSAVLKQIVDTIEADGTQVLALRLDRVDSFASTTELGRQLGLDSSPVWALALAAGDSPSALVIDQLDAVSLASGRLPANFDAVADLVREASGLPGMRVIMASRQFDVDNDSRIRDLSSRENVQTVTVNPLPDQLVDMAVSAMGLIAASLTVNQRELLRTPLHLVLLSTVAEEGNALDFQTHTDLFDTFWIYKRRVASQRRPGLRFNEVIQRVAAAMSDLQTLSVPAAILDSNELAADADVLISEHILAPDGKQIAFFHETFFDYVFARQWVTQQESLCDFLTRGEQELFRRGQVRQILHHLREQDSDRFVDEVQAVLLNPAIRYHVKDAVLALLGALTAPTADEAAAVLAIAVAHPSFEHRVWQQIRTAAWFSRLNEDGVICSWLDSDDEGVRNRALDFLPPAAKGSLPEVTRLLTDYEQHRDYPAWLRWVTRFGDVHEDRKLFDLLLDQVRVDALGGHEQELWMNVYHLAEHEPGWAVELLVAHFIERPDALRLDDDGKVLALKEREHAALDLIKVAAEREPLAFSQRLLPFVLDVIRLTGYGSHEGSPPADRHFSYRSPVGEHGDSVDDALFHGVQHALEAMAAVDPQAIRPELEVLAHDEHDSAQFLLYRALMSAGPVYAEWAAELLLESDARLECGYMSNVVWATRELVRVISPHVRDETHAKLEERFRDLRMRREQRPNGRYAFDFLSALDEARLSETGRRRLEEYRRRFNAYQPPAPTGVRGGGVNSPIATVAAQRMTDDQWLGAMKKYQTDDDTNWDDLTGGARELSHVLREQVKEDPVRFSRLAKRLTPDLNPAYGNAILMGLGEADVPADGRDEVFDGVRGIAALCQADNDRWLGMALRRQLETVPLDLVELIRDRALNSPDPVDEGPSVTIDRPDGRNRVEELHMHAINSARGSLAETLGDLLVYDVDGSRTDLVRDRLPALAQDPVLAVRATAAHTIAAALRYARPEAVAAFQLLIDTDDVLLATDLVQRLILYIGNVEADVAMPVVKRMIESDDPDCREAGGRLVAHAGLEWGANDLLSEALSSDVRVRRGIASTCAVLVQPTGNADLAKATLKQLFNDEDTGVRENAAKVAPQLRDYPLGPFTDLLEALIDSPAYDKATPQLLISLQHAPDRVDGLVLRAARRFMDMFGADAADMRTGAAGDAHYVCELIVRGLAQSRDTAQRSELLDALDRLLELGVYGIHEAIAAYERD